MDYCFLFVALLVAFVGLFGNTAFASETALTIPPYHIRLTEVSASTVTLTWDHLMGQCSYILEYQELDHSSSPSNSKPLRKHTETTSYTIRNLKPNTTYIFRVYAEHILGRILPIQSLEVTTGDPDGKTFLKFTKVPEDIKVSAGKDLRLECSADGLPTPNITWLDRFQKIDDVVVTPTGSVVLTLTNTRSSAVYTCMAASTLWTIKHKFYVTEVEIVPEPPNNVRVVEATATTVTLTWDPETANCSYMIVYKAWRKSRNPSQFDAYKNGIESTSFTITNLKPNTTYEFEVMAYNSYGLSLSSKSVEVTTEGSVIENLPKFSFTPNDVSILPGEDLNLTCSATGSPVPFVRWMEDGVELTGHGNTSFGFSALTLTDVRRSAKYTCEAWSHHGSVEHHVQVNVKVTSYNAVLISFIIVLAVLLLSAASVSFFFF